MGSAHTIRHKAIQPITQSHTQTNIQTKTPQPARMKFSVKIETESSLFRPPSTVPPQSKALSWDIDVELGAVSLIDQPKEQPKEKPKEQSLVAAPVVNVKNEAAAPVQALPAAISTVSTSTRKTTVSTRKVSAGRTAAAAANVAEERRLSKLMNPRGRKVTRQGDWLVFTERVGVLTSQNGVRQIKEERVKINADDLNRLKALGF